MKTIISILIGLLFAPTIRAQKNAIKNNVLFENPVTKEKIRVEVGNQIRVVMKSRKVAFTRGVLSLTDSSITLTDPNEPHKNTILFQNIANLKVIRRQDNHRYVITVSMADGRYLTGELVGTTKDSVRIKRGVETVNIEASKIKSLQIRKKRAIGKGIGIGAVIGSLVGAAIGYAVYTPPDCGHRTGWAGLFDFGCNDVGPEGYALGGAAIGAVLGLSVGGIIRLDDREIKIDGNKSQFDLFTNEFNRSGQISK